tara:strand:+ start:217 stop:1617 length:1401 start_codon:yes stop_codon:yes gene_type:complete
MAKVDITNENETKQETSTYKGFNNKYLKAALLAVSSYYLAKKDPYVLQGINEVKDKLEEADAESRRDYIKASATSIGKVIADNRARRKERLIDFKQKIKDLNVYTKDPYLSANMIKDGLYKEMLKFGKQGNDINTLYTVTNDFRKQNNIPTGLTTPELAGALAGPVDNISKNLNTRFLAPKKTSFISNFITGGGQEDVSDEVKAQIQAIAPDLDDDNIDDIIIGGGSLTDRGKQFLTPNIRGDYTARNTNNDIVAAIVDSTGGKLKIGKNVSGEPVYSYDSEIKERIINANLMSLDVNRRVAELLQKEQGMTRVTATQLIIRQLDLNNPNSAYIKLGLSTGVNQTKLSDFKPALSISDMQKGVKSSNITKSSKVTQNKKNTGVKPNVLNLPKTATAIQNSLLNLKNNPPMGGQGNKKVNTTLYNTDKFKLESKLMQVLTGDANSPFFNDQAKAKKYVNDFLSKNKI